MLQNEMPPGTIFFFILPPVGQELRTPCCSINPEITTPAAGKPPKGLTSRSMGCPITTANPQTGALRITLTDTKLPPRGSSPPFLPFLTLPLCAYALLCSTPITGTLEVAFTGQH